MQPLATRPVAVAVAVRVVALFVPLVVLSACSAGPPCTQSDFGPAECRVIAENEGARLVVDGYVFSFHDPADEGADGWQPRGLITVDGDQIVARVATLGDIALHIDATDGEGDRELKLVLENVHPDAELRVEPLDPVAGAPPIDVLPPIGVGLRREHELDLTPGLSLAIRGGAPCSTPFRLAVLGDIQTGVTQFESILEAIAVERALATTAGEPLHGLVLVGDLAENAVEEEFVVLDEIFATSPVPIAATTGNHDTYNQDDITVYNRHMGPGNFAFDVCTTHALMLDTGDASLAPSVEARLPALLDRGDRDHLLVGLHYPPHSGRYGNGWIHEEQQSRLIAEIGRNHADLVAAGHVHNLTEFLEVPAADTTFHQVIVGTGGAGQGGLPPRYGYLRVTFGATVERCFVNVGDLTGDADAEVEARRPDEPPLCLTPTSG